MSNELAERLEMQAKEIADAGHYGWGNTMMEAARAIRDASVSALRWDTVRQFVDGAQFDEWESMTKGGYRAGNEGNEYADRRADQLAEMRNQERTP